MEINLRINKTLLKSLALCVFTLITTPFLAVAEDNLSKASSTDEDIAIIELAEQTIKAISDSGGTQHQMVAGPGLERCLSNAEDVYNTGVSLCWYTPWPIQCIGNYASNYMNTIRGCYRRF